MFVMIMLHRLPQPQEDTVTVQSFKCRMYGPSWKEKANQNLSSAPLPGWAVLWLLGYLSSSLGGRICLGQVINIRLLLEKEVTYINSQATLGFYSYGYFWLFLFIYFKKGFQHCLVNHSKQIYTVCYRLREKNCQTRNFF